MNTKRYLYAAVGAPIMVTKATQDRFEDLRARLTKNAFDLRKDARKTVDGWATQGEKLVGKVADATAIDELAAKVDFDQVSTQVHRLRDQLEDLVDTWRTNFRPVTSAAAPQPAASFAAASFAAAPKTAAVSAAAPKTAAVSAAAPKAATAKRAAPKAAAHSAAAPKAAKRAAPKAVKRAAPKAVTSAAKTAASSAAARKTAAPVAAGSDAARTSQAKTS